MNLKEKCQAELLVFLKIQMVTQHSAWLFKYVNSTFVVTKQLPTSVQPKPYSLT
jgi:hypothetical protein